MRLNLIEAMSIFRKYKTVRRQCPIKIGSGSGQVAPSVAMKALREVDIGGSLGRVGLQRKPRKHELQVQGKTLARARAHAR